jgi:uncharacterized membrane protein YqjE
MITSEIILYILALIGCIWITGRLCKYIFYPLLQQLRVVK